MKKNKSMEHISKHLVQVKNELTDSKNGRITERPIEDLKQALRYGMLKVGLRAANLPDDEEKAILLDHISRYYGNHTPEEIKLAFDLAITDKLELDPKDVVCYENFSCLYFSNIMNAYRKWINNEFKEGRIHTVRQKLVEYKPDQTKIDEEFEAFKNNPENKRFFPNEQPGSK